MKEVCLSCVHYYTYQVHTSNHKIRRVSYCELHHKPVKPTTGACSQYVGFDDLDVTPNTFDQLNEKGDK